MSDAQTELRWPGAWRAIGWLILVVVVVGSLIPLRQRGVVFGFDKLEHFIGYALLMYWFAALHAAKHRAWFAAGFIGLGAALELAQGATGWRSADALDLAADAVGVGAGWYAAHLFGAAAFRHVERAAR